MAKGRAPNGQYIRTLEGAERDAEAARLRARGWNYTQIGDALGTDRGNAHHAVQRALAAAVREAADEVRELELTRLDDMYAAVIAVLEAKHFTVSHGKVVYLGKEPLVDDAPVLAAVDRLLKIQERRAKLLGLDAATKTEVSGGVRYEIIGVPTEEL